MNLALKCKELCNQALRRPHLTCLTCGLRRYHYGKLSKEEYSRANEYFIAFHAEKKDRVPYIVTPNESHYLIIAVNRKNKLNKLQVAAIKVLNSLEEFIGNW